MKNLFLDDIRIPIDAFLYTKKLIYVDEQWSIVRSYNEFVEFIEKNGIPEMISLDHDISTEHYAPQEHWENYDKWAAEQNFTEKTGMDCVKWIVNYCMDNGIKFPIWHIHSMNPVGSDNMKSYITSFLKHSNG